jgi:glycosyltransferase involved in cell wall biosynthesis
MADVILVPSSGGVALMRALGLPPERVVLTPYVVHNEWWIEQASRVDRAAVRARWGIPQNAPVALFCAKLQPWKRPQDLLRAFAKARVPGAYLVYAGEGPLRPALESEAKSLGMASQVRFFGFVNQSGLPAVYRSADLIVLPSEYEPFGVVINEAMLSGCAAIVSDRVGAGLDLVREGETGFVFPCGNVEALAALLRQSLGDPGRLQRLGEAARRRMDTWTPEQNIAGFVQAVEIASQMHSQPKERHQHG